MASPKTRLGRGLGSLISSGTPAKPAPAHAVPPTAPTPTAAKESADGLPGYREVPMHLIEPNPYQPRKEFDPEALTELVESIRAEGL